MRTNKLNHYMKLRAAWEKLPWDLDVAFTEGYFRQGVRNFFGVDLDNRGNLLRDLQQPDFFKAYTTACAEVRTRQNQ